MSKEYTVVYTFSPNFVKNKTNGSRVAGLWFIFKMSVPYIYNNKSAM